ncbi:YraN family protein [Curtobacterium ammoniigenes]|uniref:YraN family protein n=1 Tax=Curtobacterium ammoniigenes TaxID=395387 RepID=UPI000829E2F5|nr:YraN family protein [Curtobacterium ammoniigenes]
MHQVQQRLRGHNAAIGKRGEQIAADYLGRLGYRIVVRNWRIRGGEIDIVAKDRSTFVVAEVKTRTTAAAGHPLEAVTGAKLARLRMLALAWRSTCAEAQRAPIRIDVVGIMIEGSGTGSVVEHLQGVA